DLNLDAGRGEILPRGKTEIKAAVNLLGRRFFPGDIFDKSPFARLEFLRLPESHALSLRCPPHALHLAVDEEKPASYDCVAKTRKQMVGRKKSGRYLPPLRRIERIRSLQGGPIPVES